MRIFLFLCSSVLCAQSLELSGSAGATRFAGNPIGYLGFTSATTPVGRVEFNPGWQAAMRFTWNQSRWFGHEAGLSYGRHRLTHEVGTAAIAEVEADRSLLMAFYDLLAYATPEDAKVRPFLAAGFVGTGFRAPQVAVQISGRQEATKLGLNFGGGVKIPVAEHWFVRADVRDYATPKPLDLIAQEGWLHQVEVSAGIGLRF
jgi:opacity protein-like surface antigen